MTQVQEIDRDELHDARAEVARFFAGAAELTTIQLAALSREQRRSRSRLSTDPEFLQSVCTGAWSPSHSEAAREIRVRARAQAAALVPWPRRASLATALEETALAVLSEADPQRPLRDDLCRRLRQPWERAVGSVVLPVQRPATS